jgi:hypothetical protein
MNKPVTVAITGAAGQIGYQLAFRVASGQLLGNDQPVNLHLLEITPTLPALQGPAMVGQIESIMGWACWAVPLLIAEPLIQLRAVKRR